MVQLGVEPTMRGRVMALYLIAFMGGTPLGAPIVGWIAETLGPRWSMLGGGLISLVFTVSLGLLVASRQHVGPRGLRRRFAIVRA
jgi:predicted MFS family arabinose efflux permease